MEKDHPQNIRVRNPSENKFPPLIRGMVQPEFTVYKYRNVGSSANTEIGFGRFLLEFCVSSAGFYLLRYLPSVFVIGQKKAQNTVLNGKEKSFRDVYQTRLPVRNSPETLDDGGNMNNSVFWGEREKFTAPSDGGASMVAL